MFILRKYQKSGKKFLHYSTLVLLLCIHVAFTQSEHKKEKIIIWSQSCKLQWTDYMAKPDLASPLNAVTFYQVETSFHMVGADYSEKVTASVDRTKSWVKDTATATLQHEQLHFDMAELYARMIRKSLSELKEKGVERRSEIATKLTEEYSHQLHEEQERYDQETKHGQDTAKQEEWRVDVQKRLKEYGFFKN